MDRGVPILGPGLLGALEEAGSVEPGVVTGGEEDR